MHTMKLIPYSILIVGLLTFLLLASKSKKDQNKFSQEKIVYDDSEGEHNRTLTRITYTENVDELHLSSSPDGSQLAYEGWMSANKMGVFVVSNKSADIKSIVHTDDHINRFPNWDATGTLVYFVPMRQLEKTLTSKIVYMHNGGISNLHLIPTHSDDEITSLSVSSKGHLVYSQKVNGVHKINLLNSKENYRVELTNGQDVACSYDASQIAFVKVNGESSQLFIMNIDGADQKEVATGLHLVKSPSFSPNGKWLTFCGQNTIVKGKKSTTNWDIFMLEIGSQKIVQLTSDPADDVNPIWSKDNHIYFSSSRFGNFEIMKVNPGVK